MSIYFLDYQQVMGGGIT